MLQGLDIRKQTLRLTPKRRKLREHILIAGIGIRRPLEPRRKAVSRKPGRPSFGRDRPPVQRPPGHRARLKRREFTGKRRRPHRERRRKRRLRRQIAEAPGKVSALLHREWCRVNQAYRLSETRRQQEATDRIGITGRIICRSKRNRLGDRRARRRHRCSDWRKIIAQRVGQRHETSAGTRRRHRRLHPRHRKWLGQRQRPRGRLRIGRRVKQDPRRWLQQRIRKTISANRCSHKRHRNHRIHHQDRSEHQQNNRTHATVHMA